MERLYLRLRPILVTAVVAMAVGALVGFVVGFRQAPPPSPDVRAVALLGSPFASVGGALLPVLTVNTGGKPFRIVDIRLADDADVPWRLLPQPARDVAPGEVDDRPVRFDQDCAGPPAWALLVLLSSRSTSRARAVSAAARRSTYLRR